MQEETVKKRKSYTSRFKLMVCERALKVGNRTAAREHGVDERCVRRWKDEKESLKNMSMLKRARRGGTVAWPVLEDRLEKWIREQMDQGLQVNTIHIRVKAKCIAQELGLRDFKGGPPWYYRFMRRKNLMLLKKCAPGESNVMTTTSSIATTEDTTVSSSPDIYIVDSDPDVFDLIGGDDEIDSDLNSD